MNPTRVYQELETQVQLFSTVTLQVAVSNYFLTRNLFAL